jgi:hypothetical protein
VTRITAVGGKEREHERGDERRREPDPEDRRPADRWSQRPDIACRDAAR